MKKFFSILVLTSLMLSMSVLARTTYNPDNTINISSTIRGQKKLRQEQKIAQKNRKMEAAAAAKIDYNNNSNCIPYDIQPMNRK